MSDLVKRLNETLGGIETPAMGGDNLAITLCSHFDDGEEHDNEHGWSNAAHDGYMEVIEAIRKHYEPAAARIEALEAGLNFQNGVDLWMNACFGETIKHDKLERADRFIEEALELTQAMGYSADRAHALVDYVFNRPIGEAPQEVGGVMVTLAALCNTVDVQIFSAAQTELARVWTKVEQIRAKQAAKPTGSALPVAASLLEKKGSG